MDKDGVKFAVLCMQVSRQANLRKLALDGPCNFCVEPPASTVALNTWREVAGTWQLDEIRRAGLWVWTTAKSKFLGVQNAENDRLHGRMVNYWISLLLHEPPDLRLPWVLTGHFEAGKPVVSSLAKLIGVFRQQTAVPNQLTPESLENVATIAGNVDIVLESAQNDPTRQVEQIRAAIANAPTTKLTAILVSSVRDDVLPDVVREAA